MRDKVSSSYYLLAHEKEKPRKSLPWAGLSGRPCIYVQSSLHTRQIDAEYPKNKVHAKAPGIHLGKFVSCPSDTEGIVPRRHKIFACSLSCILGF